MMRRLYIARILNVLGVLTLAVVGWVTYQRTQALIVQNREILHSHEGIRAINQVLSDVQYAETGQRGYLLTGDDTYLEPYERGTAQVQQTFDTLADTVADDETQGEDLHRLEAATEAKLTELRETIRLRREEGLQAALRVVETDEGQRLMDTIRALADAMTTREQALLGEQLSDANKKSARALTLMEASIGLAGVLFVTSGLLISLDLLRSRREASELAEALDVLNPVLAAHPTKTAVINPAGKVISSNIERHTEGGHGAGSYEGATYDELLREITGLAKGESQNVKHQVAGVLQGNSEQLYQRVSVSADEGTTTHYAVRAKPVTIREARHVLLCFTDITKSANALETARLNEEMFRLALAHAPIGMALISPDGDWLRVNRALCDMLGYDEEELLLTHFQALTHPDDLERDTALVQKLLAKEINSYQTEKRLIRKDGESIWVLLSSAVVWDADGQPRYLIRQNQNINQRKLAERELRLNKERLELALSGGELGTWDWDVPLGRLHYDTRWAEMLGYTVEELAPDLSTWEQLVHPEDKSAVLAVLEQHLRGDSTSYEAEHRLRHKDGSWVWVLTKGKVIERDIDGNPLRACGTHLDITEEKEARETLAETGRELERSNQELEDFAYIASHDLKEPLRGIRNFAAFLLEDYEDKLEDEGQHQLHTLVKLAERLEHFIDALLRYSRVGRTEMTTEPVDLHAQVEGIIESLQSWLDEYNGQVTIRESLPEVSCHPALGAEVFRNLITNGIKYNDSEQKRIEIGRTNGRTEIPVFYVRDNGIGIPEKFQSAIFRIFKRLHGRDKYGGGTGAGLSIVQKIIDRHGGSIWLESTPGSGTTFYFTLQPGENNDG